MLKFCYLFVLLALMALSPVFGQVLIDIQQFHVETISIESNVSIQANNTLPEAQNCFIKLSYSISGKILYECTFQNILLNRGVQTINTNALIKSNEVVYDDKLRTNKIISSGTVMICVDVFNVQDNLLVTNYCSSIVLKEKEEEKLQKNFPVKISGYAEVSGNYATRKGSFQELPANYTNVIVNPELEAFGVPLGAKINYSTASDKRQQNMNLFTLYFDSEKFKEKLKSKYTTVLSREQLFEESELTDLTKNKEEYKKLTSILNNPHVKSDLAKLHKLDSINRLLQDSSVYFSQRKNKDLKAIRDSLTPIESKRKGYCSLIEKHRQFGSIVQSYENSLDTTELKDSLERLKKKIENNRNPFTENDETQLTAIDSLLNTDDPKISKQRREILKQQRDGLAERKKRKDEYENLKENYAVLQTTYEKRKKLDSLKNKKNDALAYINDSAEKQKKIKDKISFLKSVKSFSIGYFAPQTGEFTLNGVPIRGIGIETEFKYFFFNIGFGKVQRSTISSSLNNSPTPFSRKLFTSTIGIGKFGGNYLSVQLISSNDDKETILTNTNDTTEINNSMFVSNSGKNKVISTRFHRQLLRGKIIIEGELAGSQISSAPTRLTENLSQPPESNWAQNIFLQTNSSSYRTGHAYSAAISQFFNKFTTKLTLSRRLVSPNYVSFGSPFLLTDILTNEVKITQLLWKGKVNLSSFYRLNSDNINSIKSTTTNTLHYGGDISIRIPNLPTLRIAYTPLIRMTQGNYFMVKMLSVNSVYGWRRGLFYHQWSTNYMAQTSKSRIGYNNFSSQSHTGNYLLNFRQKFNASITFSYLKQISITSVEGFTGGASAGYTYKKNLTQQLGYSFTDNNLGMRQSLFYELGATLIKNVDCKIRYSKTTYKKQDVLLYDASYNENVLIFSILKKW